MPTSGWRRRQRAKTMEQGPLVTFGGEKLPVFRPSTVYGGRLRRLRGTGKFKVDFVRGTRGLVPIMKQMHAGGSGGSKRSGRGPSRQRGIPKHVKQKAKRPSSKSKTVRQRRAGSGFF